MRYARYCEDNEIPYIVNFKTNTSKGTVTKILDSASKTSATMQISSLGTLSKSGYYFKGWYFDKEYTVPLTSENDIITSDVTLYAKWAEPMQFNAVSYSPESNSMAVSFLLDEELEKKNGAVIIAIYDDTKLIATYYTDTAKTISHVFENLPVAKSNYIIKGFCWSDLDNMFPLCEDISTIL